MRTFHIGARRIADDEPCYVVAELGSNHQGDLDLARQLIRMSAAAGADAVKLQKRDLPNLYTRALWEMPYDSEVSFGATYGAHRQALEFSPRQHAACQDLATELGIACFATAFDAASVDVLMALAVPALKFGSGSLDRKTHV